MWLCGRVSRSLAARRKPGLSQRRLALCKGSLLGEKPARKLSNSLQRHLPRESRRRSSRSRQPLYVAVLAASALAVFLWNRRGQQPSLQRTCTGPPSVAERLKLFKEADLHHAIWTDSDEAQQLFNQGLLLAWDFDQPEAKATFQLAAATDANASMPFWGIQYAVGPGANRAMLSTRPTYPAFAPDNFPAAQGAARTALKLAEAAAAANPTLAAAKRDLAYAKAAVVRWPDGSAHGPARFAAEAAYSRALAEIGEKNEDGAALVMAAEALMNLHPWEYYTASGDMKETSREAERLINASLARDPDNALANHLKIHISEASNPLQVGKYSALRGTISANRMHFGKGPWSANQGHLLHMPSHTYVRTGRYYDAAEANINAYNADLFFAQHCLVPYEPEHNTDMLIFSASMAGAIKIAEEFALKIRTYIDIMFYRRPTETTNWAKFPLLLTSSKREAALLMQAHFAKWKEVMQLQRPGPLDRANCPSGGAQFAQVVWRYVRVLAAAARAEGALLLQEPSEFEKLDGLLDTYLQLLKEAEAKVVPEEPTKPPAVYICEHKGLAQIYTLTAEARIAFLRNKTQEAAGKLRAAIAIEDGFAYMEPPRVYQPVRQCLGYVLARAGSLEEALQVYTDDLAIYPENGWSLHGLSDVLHRLDRHAELKALRPRLEAAWKHAEVAVDSSCLVFSKPWGGPPPV